MSVIPESVPLRSGTTADWGATTLVLGVGELGIDTTLGVMKAGNGTDLWASLDAVGGGGGGAILDGAQYLFEINDGATLTASGNAVSLIFDTGPEGYEGTLPSASALVPAGLYAAWVEVDFDAPAEDRVLSVKIGGSGMDQVSGPFLLAATGSHSSRLAVMASGTVRVSADGNATQVAIFRSTAATAVSPADLSINYMSLLLTKIG